MGTLSALLHYNDVIMSAMASQITSLMIVYSTVNSGADQRKHQSSASLAFVQWIHRGPVNSLHKGPVTWKMFPFDDIYHVFLCMRKMYGRWLHCTAQWWNEFHDFCCVPKQSGDDQTTNLLMSCDDELTMHSIPTQLAVGSIPMQQGQMICKPHRQRSPQEVGYMQHQMSKITQTWCEQ